jgi:hypothetical protein
LFRPSPVAVALAVSRARLKRSTALDETKQTETNGNKR